MGADTLTARKRREISARIGGIRDALDTLEALSRTEALTENTSQIAAVRDSVGALVEEVAKRVESGHDGVAESWARLEELLLTVYRIFGYFWEKFAQRQTSGARDTLLVADDFAAACYAPIRSLLLVTSADIGPPPLVCFDDGARGAYSLARWTPFDRYLRFDQDTGPVFRTQVDLTAQQLEKVRALPMGVIALPWFTLGHPPDLLIVAHEIGHLVAGDLGLVGAGGFDPARVGLAGVFGARTAFWLAELFADAYAALCAGVAFGHVLADYLATGSQAADATATHPAPDTRIRLIARVLRLMGHGEDGTALLRQWYEEWPGIASFPGRISDEVIEAVAERLVGTGHEALGGRRLTEVPGFADGAFQDQVSRLIYRLRHREDIPDETAVRVLLSALAVTVGSGAGAETEDLSAWALRVAVDQRHPSERGDGPDGLSGTPMTPYADAHQERERQREWYRDAALDFLGAPDS